MQNIPVMTCLVYSAVEMNEDQCIENWGNGFYFIMLLQNSVLLKIYKINLC